MGIKEDRASCHEELEALYTNARNLSSWRLSMLREAYLSSAKQSIEDAVGADMKRLEDLKELCDYIATVDRSASREVDQLNRAIIAKISDISGVSPGYRQTMEDFIVAAAKISVDRFPDIAEANDQIRQLYTDYREISYQISLARKRSDINELMERANEKFA